MALPAPIIITPPEGATIIRVTERMDWRDCRRKWYYKYVLELVKKNEKSDARHMGTAFHSCMSAYNRALMAGLDHAEGQQAAWGAWAIGNEYTDGIPAQEGLDPEQVELIQGMLANYFDHYNPYEDGWKPQFVEQRFYAQIPGTDAYISGQMDVIYLIPGKGLYVHDYKTYTNFLTTEQIEFSDQMNVYIWILLQNGIRVRGAIYDMVRKKLPTVPLVLKGGGLSKNSNICTTKKVYAQAVLDNGLRLEDYEDFISGMQEADFFKREWLVRSPRFIAKVGEDLTKEIAEMVSDDTPIYPNFHQECIYCSYKGLCRTASDQGDVNMMIRMDYDRVDTNVAVRRDS